MRIGGLLFVLVGALLAGNWLLPRWLAKFDKNAYIRVNQLGYEIGEPMRAYVMAIPSRLSGRFVVRNDAGEEMTSGTIGATTGKWGVYSVFPIDFSVASPGDYKLVVTGPASVASPKFHRDSAPQLFAVALQHALQFF